MNKPLLSKISMITIFLIGWLIMTYPFYVNAVNFFIDSYRSSQYEKELQAKYEQELAKWEAKNQQIAQKGLHPGSDPFEENSSNKAEQKMLKHHYLGKINIPKLALEIPLFDTTTPYLLEQGATVLDGTSLPIGGENTHSVITAHRGLPQRELFTNLPKLVEQDIFLIEIAGRTQAYQVIDSQVVTPEDTSILSIQAQQELVTLVTCTPYMINTHRLLVTGKRVPYTEEIANKQKERDKMRWLKQIGIALGIILSLFLTIRKMYGVVKRHRKVHESK